MRARMADEDARSTTDADGERRSATQSDAENAGTDALTPPPPTVDLPIGAGSRRPPLPSASDPLRSDAPTSDALRTPPSNASDFTSEELDLLGSKGITRAMFIHLGAFSRARLLRCLTCFKVKK